MRWERTLINREFRKEIEEAKKTSDRDEVSNLENSRAFEMGMIDEEEESLYTEQLLKRAARLRVPVPSRPKLVSMFEYEESEDWQQYGPQGLPCLTVKGITKVREEIRKEEKWRREARANWAVLLSALGGVIGSITGLAAVLLK